MYVDDGVSGGEWGKKRPGLQALLAAAERGAFRVLIVSERKSIGREAVETAMVIKRLAQAGVEVFGYMDGRSLTPRNAMDKVMGALTGYKDEAHREDTSKRNYEAATRGHARGHVQGGRVYGYRNVHVYDGVDQHGNPRRSHTAREVDPTEAAVVVQIFQMFSAGLGLKRICHRLTSEGAPPPKPFVRKDGSLPPVGWVPSTVRAVLRRTDYVGIYTWGKTKKRDSDGAVAQRDRPESEWQRTPMPEWRIVSDDLWDAVAARCKDVESRAVRFSDGRLRGRPKRQAVHHLLAGIATCGVCGGGMVAETYTQSKTKPRVPHYVCARRRANGACANGLRLSVAAMDKAVLSAVESIALTEEAVEQVILHSERADVTDRQTILSKELKDIRKRIQRMNAAIELSDDPPVSSLARLRELEARQTAIVAEASSLQPVPRLPREVIETRLEEWRRLIRGSVTQGRQVLERLLAGRIVFTPRADGLGYDFTAPTAFGNLFVGIAHGITIPGFSPRDWVLCPDGVEDPNYFTNRDVTEADYGRLLEQALNRARVSSPTGFEPVFWP